MKPILARLVSICFLSSLCLPVSALETRAGVEIKGDTAVASGHFSTGVSEILKMIDAKVDLEVIKGYIKNSRIAYNPSASEIIALKDRGVPNEILAAMLQHGAELRAQSLAAAPLTPQTPPYNGGGVPFDYSMGQTAPYPDLYGDDYYGGYGGYPYGGYPYSYWYYYNYPYWPYYSSLYLGYPFFFSRFHSFNRNHFFAGSRGFHNGFHRGFAGHPWGTAGFNNFHRFGNSGRSFSTFGGGFHGSMGHAGGFSGSGFRGGGGHSGGGGFHGHR